MSYQSREKKRRYKRAVQKQKRNRSPETAHRWFKTFAGRACACACCRKPHRRRAEIVYRHEPREVRCVRCADERDDSKGYRESLRWLAAQRRRQQTAA